ncbi:MAG TPA: hypothetical protein VIL13_05140 [Longimicrobiales bacterium]
MSETTPALELEPIELDEDARELIEAELAHLLQGMPDERRVPYERLSEAVAAGRVEPELAPLLERVVGLALDTGRARRLYRAEGERILTDVFRRTPGGRALTRSVEAVNRALAASLAGRALRSVRVGMRTLGHFTIELDAEGVSLTLAVRKDGVSIESLGASA